MASIIKRTYTSKIPVLLSNGQPKMKDGKPVYRTIVKQCGHWTIQFDDPITGKRKRVKGYKDRAATKQLAAKIEASLARGEQGLIDPYRVSRATSLADHVAEWLEDLRAKGRSAKYIDTADRRLGILIAECSWSALSDVDCASFLTWRQTQRKRPRKGTRKDFTVTSGRTLNQYLEVAQAFLNWSVKTKRVAANALHGIDKVFGEKVRKRRALSDEQVAALLAVAPPERSIVYRMGWSVGLRRSELAALKWADLGLVAIPPFVQLRAECTKAKRGDRVYMATTLAEELRKLRGDAGDGDRVFPRVPPLREWKDDLAAAGIPYRDALGRQVDFHAGCRKTLATRMNRNGVPLVIAMRTMRHVDVRLTAVDYTDDDGLGLPGSVLPEIAPGRPAAEDSDAKAGGAG